MYKRILVICCILLISLTQSGCIGLIINTPEECKNETPFTGIHDSQHPQFNPTFSHVAPKVQPPKRSTKAEFLKDWGKPDEIISSSESVETWIYNRKLWCGVMPVLILPVPLIIPVCDGFDRIEFKDNVATRLHTRRIVLGGGILLLTTFGTGAGSMKDPVCRFPLPPNNGVDSDTAKPAAQVTP